MLLTDAPGIPSVEDLPHIAFTTSGRSAIYQTLLQLQLPPNSAVLVPTYHCPTMVAPVLLADLQPIYFGVRALAGLTKVAMRTVFNQSDTVRVAPVANLVQGLRQAKVMRDDHGTSLLRRSWSNT